MTSRSQIAPGSAWGARVPDHDDVKFWNGEGKIMGRQSKMEATEFGEP